MHPEDRLDRLDAHNFFVKIWDVARWLERGALQLPLTGVRVRAPLDAVFRINIMFLPFQHWDIVSMFVSLGNKLCPHMLHLTEV